MFPKSTAMNYYKNDLPLFPIMLAVVVLFVLLLNCYSFIISF